MKVSWKKDRNDNGYILHIVLAKNDPDVTTGSKVTVQKKDGGTTEETVDTVLWAGESTYDDASEGDLVVLATARKKPRSARALARAAGEEESEEDIPF